MKKVRFLALLLSVLLVVSFTGCKKNNKSDDNQDTKAVVAGWLMDATEQLLPEKTVKLIEVGSDDVLTTTTDSSGTYYFSDIVAGEYKLSVTADDGNDISSEGTYLVNEAQTLYLKVIFDGKTLKIDIVNEDGTIADSTTNGNNQNQSNNNSTTSNNNSSNKNNGSGKDKVLASLKGTTIKVLDWNGIGTVTGAKECVKSFEKKTGIKVDFVVKASNEYNSAIASMVASGDSPDVVRIMSANPANIKHLQPIKNTGNDFKDSIWDQRISDYYTVNGNVYAVNRADTLIQIPTVMYYNKDHISKYSLDDPYTLWKEGKWTFDNFLRLCREFKDETGSGYYAWSPNNILYFTSQRGYPLATLKNGSLVNNFSNEAIKATQEFLSYKEEGLVGPTYDTEGFDKGKYLFGVFSMIDSRTTHFSLTGLKGSNSLGAVPYPVFEGQSARTVFAEAQAYGVAKGAKNIKAVPYYLEYYLDPDNYEAKTFFNDAKILDVYKSLMACKDYNVIHDPLMPVSEAGGRLAYESYIQLESSTADQASVVMNQMKSAYEAGIKKVNAAFAEVK